MALTKFKMMPIIFAIPRFLWPKKKEEETKRQQMQTGAWAGQRRVQGKVKSHPNPDIVQKIMSMRS